MNRRALGTWRPRYQLRGGRKMQDLTDRRFLALLEAAPDAMVCVEGDGRIALVNAQAERLFGYHREELIGQRVETLAPESVRGAPPAGGPGFVPTPNRRPGGAGGHRPARRRDGCTF